jgi:hypothetical protein
MSNSVLSNFSSPSENQQSPSLFDMYNQVRHSKNPDQAMQILFANNPQYQNVMSYIQQNGGDARSAYYNMAAQMGVDPNLILSKLR